MTGVLVLGNSNRKVRKGYGSGMQSPAEFYAEWLVKNKTDLSRI